MNIIQIVLTVAITLLGYPLGLLISHFTQEELRTGRKWFKLILLISLIFIILALIFFSAESNILMFLLSVLVFIFLLALASFIKAKKLKK